MPRLYGLLVGIDEYPNPAHRLYGCVNDVNAMKQYLEVRVAPMVTEMHLETLVSSNATRLGVMNRFAQHLGTAGEGDTALFFFAGHGSQQIAPPEFWAIEPDRCNETLVCWDSRLPDRWDLADKELAMLIKTVASRGAHVVIVLDCCHSGSGTREVDFDVVERRIPTDSRIRPFDSFSPEVQASMDAPTKRSVTGWQFGSQGRHILLAACRDFQTAKEYSGGGQRHGVFTYFLLDTLRNATSHLTYGELYLATRNQVLAQFNSQSPQLEAIESSDANRPFLNLSGETRHVVYTVCHDNSLGWIIDAGIIHGLPKEQGEHPCELAIFRLDEKAEAMRDLAQALTTAKVTEVLSTRSQIDITIRSAVTSGTTYKAVVIAMPLPAMLVKLQGDDHGLTFVRRALETAGPNGTASSYVKEGEEASYRLLARDNEYVIVGPNNDRPLVQQIKSYSPENAERAVVLLEHISKWATLAKLKSCPILLSELDVALTVLKSRNPEQPFLENELRLSYVRKDDQWIRPCIWLKVTNNSQRTLHCALLVLTDLFGVMTNFLSAGTQQLEPGQSFYARNGDPIYMKVDQQLQKQGVTEARDIFKLIVCTEPFDIRSAEQPELEGPNLRSTSVSVPSNAPPAGTLSRLFTRIQHRGVDTGVTDEPIKIIDDFITKTIYVSTIRPHDGSTILPDRQTALGFGVHLLPHPELRAVARLTTLNHISRDLGSHMLPPIFRQDPAQDPGWPAPQTLQFSSGRGSDPGLNVMELVPSSGLPVNYGAVTRELPFRIRIDSPISKDEYVIPVAFDGEFYLPLGRSRPDGDAMIIDLYRLPAPVENEQRSLTGSIRILFQKLVAKPLGFGYEYPVLAIAQLDPSGDVLYQRDAVQTRVAAARRVIVFIHGIIGDTLRMAGCLDIKSPEVVILAFDYENLHTTIEETAAALKERLAEVGLRPGHNKTVQIVAHSMGGLVSRYFIERLEGNRVVSQLIMLGTPNAGSPWSSIEDWITSSVALVMNGLSSVSWPAKIVGDLFGVLEKIDNSLDQMKPGSAFLNSLAQASDPNVPYIIISGDTSSIEPARASAIRRLMHRVLSLPFLNEANDVAVSVTSINSVPQHRQPSPTIVAVSCDHLSYFRDSLCLSKLSQFLKVT